MTVTYWNKREKGASVTVPSSLLHSFSISIIYAWLKFPLDRLSLPLSLSLSLSLLTT